MLDLKNRKYKILLHIVIIISLMILMISFARLDKYKGKITFNNISSEKKVLSSVGDTLFASSRGYDEVEYKVNYTLDEIEGITKRDVIIRGKIDELDSKYAYFKEIHKNNISSTLNNNGREIEVRIKNVTLGEEHSINLKIVIEGAPNGKRITPEIYIKESTGEETKINTDSILVETRSVEGIVTDEDDLELNTIELSLYKNDEEIRRTFTDERGRFVFTDLEDGEYTIHIEEDNYEMDNDITINDETTVEIKLRKVDKYNVVINKYIDKVNLIVNGKEYNYTYNDVSKVVQNVEKAKSVSGEIEYKIVVENNSNKLSEISKVIDEPSEGLIFNKDKNTGWEEINDILVYRPMSSITLNPYEKREIKLVLDIENTKNAKNYFNKATSKGEIKEKVTYLLNNEVIKEETVIEGDTIKEPSLNIENFDGWYTDKNYTNKYDFKNEVNKDLILYGRTRIILINHIVTFMSDEEIFYKDLEVLDMTSIEKPIDNPTKEHYVFKKWVTENNEEFDFNTLITEDTTLYAVFEKVEEPTINISPSTWTKENVTVSLTNSNSDYSFMYKIDNGNYSLYTGEFTVNKNSTIYSYSIYNDVASEETSLEITNIDKINPILNNLNLDALTPVQAEISFNLKDNESGIKKYNVYLNNELIYESDEYTNLVNEEKEENYIVSGLEELSTYTIKVEAVDKVGNTSSDEISISTPAKVYVCQIESVNGTDLNEPIKLESLTEAIEYNNSGINCLTNTCEIKMLLDIEESSTILNGQDIILNLNGKYISGTNDSTITNNGNLQIINNDEETIGHIFNTNGIGIKNNGVLTIGVDEETPVVSKVDPVIEGTIYGIENNNKLNFYDGKIVGDVAIKGEVTTTPYLYSPSISNSQSSNNQVLTLNILVDAEIRRNSVYYTSIQSGVNESSQMDYEEVDYTRPLIEQLNGNDDYKFVYIENGNYIISNNRNVHNSVAHSYIKLDLTNYEEDQLLTVNAEISSQNNKDIGYVIATESKELPSSNITQGRFIYISGEVSAKDYTTILEKGKVYYLHICYSKNANINYGNDIFKINNISMGRKISYLDDIENLVMYSDSKYIFEKQNDGSYVSTNTGIDNSISESYFVLDLTNVNEEKYIKINAKISSEEGKDFGYIIVTDDSKIPNINNVESSICISGSIDAKDYLIKLIPSKINFIHFVYKKDYYKSDGEDKFKIISIKNTEESTEDNISITNNGNYYFEEYNYNPFVWKDTLGNNDAYLYGSHLNENNNGFVFDGNSYALTDAFNLTNFSINIKFNASSDGIIFSLKNSDNSSLKLSLKDNYIHVYEKNLHTNMTYELLSINSIEYGRDYTVTLVSDNSFNSFLKLYLDGIYQTQITNSIMIKNTEIIIGNDSTTSFDNALQGTIYNFNVYDSVLTDEEISNNSNNNYIANLDATNSKNNEKCLVSNNTGVSNSSAKSYLMFDLTDSTEDKYLLLDTEIFSENEMDFGYIIVTNSPLAPNYNESNGRYALISGENKSNYKIKLDKGQVNYVHFGYYKNKNINSLNDSFIIKNIRLYGTSSGLVYILKDYKNYSTDTFYEPVLNQKEDTIQLLKNITLTSSLEIDKTKILTLDLNGYTLTNNINDYVIKNKGHLIIGKSDYPYEENVNENSGQIISTTNSTILNDNGYLDLEDGQIIIDKEGSYEAISNKGTLKIGNNGVVIGNKGNNTGIYNYYYGDIIDGSGTVITNESNSKAIYNNSLYDTYIKGYTLINNGSNSYNFYGNGLNDIVLDGIVSKGISSDIYHESNNNISIVNSNLESSGSYSYYSSETSKGGEVLFDNCNIKNRIYSRRNSNRKIIINNSNLESTKDDNIYNFDGIVIINNSSLTSSKMNVENYGELRIEDSTLNTNIYSIQNGNISSSVLPTLIINNTTINTKGLESSNKINDYIKVTIPSFVYTDKETQSRIFVPEKIITSEISSPAVIYNNGNSTLNSVIINNEINSYYGIINSKKSKLSLLGNSMINSNFIVGIYNTGELVVGDNNDSLSKEYPLVEGSTSAVKNDGIFNYYDGKLVGQIDITIDGVVNDLCDFAYLKVARNNNVEINSLEEFSSQESNENFVAKIGNIKYSSLKEAINAVPNNNIETEIVLLDNIESATPHIVDTNKNIVINLKNHYIKSYYSGNFITNNGTLAIKDDSEEVTAISSFYGNFIVNNGNLSYNNAIIKNLRTGKNLIKNYGNFSFNSGKIYSELLSEETRVIDKESFKFYAESMIINNGLLNINGGEINVYASKAIENNGNINISDGIIKKTIEYTIDNINDSDILISNNSDGIINITGGSFEDKGLFSTFENSGTITITNGIFKENGYYNPYTDYDYNDSKIFVDNLENSSLIIEGGTFQEGNGLLVRNAGTASIKNITIDFYRLCNNTGTVTFENVTARKLNTIEKEEMGYGIVNEGVLTLINGSYYGNTGIISSNGSLTIEGSNIESLNDALYPAIRISGEESISTISSGIITSPLVGIVIDEANELTIGSKGGLNENNELKPSKTNPKIQGSFCGILIGSENTIFNFYDGVIIGQQALYGGNISNLEPGYMLISDFEDSLEHKYLDSLTFIQNDRTKVEYNNLQDAFMSAEDEDTLVLLTSVVLPSELDTVVIENNKNITIDLNGNVITSGNSKFIENRGNLTIIDNNKENESAGITSQGILIDNIGNLTINSGVYTRNTSKNNYLFNNSGTMIITSEVTISDVESNYNEENDILMPLINNSGELSVTGITIGNAMDYTFENEGTLIINNVETLTEKFINNKENGITTINGGTYTSANLIKNAGTATINSGEFIVIGGQRYTENGVEPIYYIDNDGEFLIKDGDFNNLRIDYSFVATIIRNNGNISIEGGNFPIEGKKNVMGYNFDLTKGNLIENTGVGIIKNINIDYKQICNNTGTMTLDNVTNSSGSIVSSGVLNIINSEFTNSDISINSSLLTKIINSTIYSNKANTIVKDGSGELIVVSGEITGSTGIMNSGIGTITIGIKSDFDLNGNLNMSTTNPIILGSSSGYGINNLNDNANINFYDGKIKGSTAINGYVNEVEPGYRVINSTEDSLEYIILEKVPLVKNKRTNEEYYSLKEAINSASNGDTLALLTDGTILPNDETILVNIDQTLILDLNGKKLTTNNDLLIENKGTLTVIDDTSPAVDSLGEGGIISNKSKIFKNSGTLTIKDGTYEKRNNETNSLLENNGTVVIDNLRMETKLNESQALIINNNEIEINGGTITTSYTKSIDNNGLLNIKGGNIIKKTITNRKESEVSDNFIYNSINGEINISGGYFEDQGTLNTIDNDGELNITGGTFNENDSSSNATQNLILNKGTTIVKDSGSFSGSAYLINNLNVATIKNISPTIKGLAKNTGTLSLENINGESNSSYSGVIINNGNLTIEGGIYNYNGTILKNNSDMTIEGITFITNGTAIIQDNKKTLNIKDVIIQSNNDSIIIRDRCIANIKSGSITSSNGSGINVERGTLNLGVEGGIPDTDNPYIKGKTYGVYNSDTFNYYDGRVVGETGSIYGTINKTESGYKEQRENITNNETGVTTIESTLTLMGETEKVAIVNNINFTSLQGAINYAVANEIPDVILYSNVVLEENLTKPEGININLYLNGRTITQGNYLIDEGITLIDEEEPSGVLGAIYKFFANIMGTEINPKNIIIYQMNDGEELESNEVYHLYKLIDGNYKQIKLNEESINEYKIGKETTDLRTNRGKLFIYDIGEGSYKLTSNNKELLFEITANNVSSNIRVNTRTLDKRMSSSEASLLIMIQTGLARYPLILIIMILVVLILGLIALKKYKEQINNCE